jgi:hypothetical protein
MVAFSLQTGYLLINKLQDQSPVVNPRSRPSGEKANDFASSGHNFGRNPLAK